MPKVEGALVARRRELGTIPSRTVEVKKMARGSKAFVCRQSAFVDRSTETAVGGRSSGIPNYSSEARRPSMQHSLLLPTNGLYLSCSATKLKSVDIRAEAARGNGEERLENGWGKGWREKKKRTRRQKLFATASPPPSNPLFVPKSKPPPCLQKLQCQGLLRPPAENELNSAPPSCGPFFPYPISV